MFVVARRTKYRVSESVHNLHVDAASITLETNQRQPELQAHSNPTHKSIPITQQPTLPEQTLHSATSGRQPTFDTATQHVKPIRTSTANTLPDFSLQYYLDMAHRSGNPAERGLSNTNRWAHHLIEDRILQIDHPKAQQPHQARRPPDSSEPQPYTSTPLDPAAVPAEALDVYWEHPCKYLHP